MSTDYEVLKRGGETLVALEHSSKLDLLLFKQDSDDVAPILEELSPDQVVMLAVELLKVSSYVDPEALHRVAKEIGDKPDWGYYHEVLRGLL